MTTLEYAIDMKAIRENYPDETNTARVLNNLLSVVEQSYERVRASLMKTQQRENAQNRYLGYNTNPPPIVEYPSYKDSVLASHTTSMGVTYNDVVTVDSVVTLEVSNDLAVKILNSIDIIGTFYVIPANRLTGY